MVKSLNTTIHSNASAYAAIGWVLHNYGVYVEYGLQNYHVIGEEMYSYAHHTLLLILVGRIYLHCLD